MPLNTSILWRNGVHLPGPQLWLDPHGARPEAVVSHAHADHMGRHGRALVSAPTAAMMRLRGATRCDFQVAAWDEPVAWGEANISLHPAGHVLGSSQVLVEWRGARVLYSGDFKLRPGLSCETAVVPRCDVLVMETTFGLPRYEFPPAADVLSDIGAWCRAMLNEGRAPVVFCYSLGKGPEVLAGLKGADFPIYLAPAHWKMANLYRGFGVELPPYKLFEPSEWRGKTLDGALLCASQCRRAAWWSEMRGARTAYVSGWALDDGARFRFGTDAAFALSDHADYPDLWRYVRQSGARRILTLHGFAREFAADLRAAGLDARALEDEDAPPQREPVAVGAKARAAGNRARAAERAGQLCLF